MNHEYHQREWLNPEGKFATSTITAYHGVHPSDIDDETPFTKLVISSCHESAHIHPFYGDTTLYPFIDKVNVIVKVCSDFAAHLTRVQQELDLIEWLEKP